MEKPLEAGKVQSGVVTHESVSLQGDSLEARIRQIVREEIAAHGERQKQKRLSYLSESHKILCDIGAANPL